MKQFLKNELTGWKCMEVLWLLFCCGVITGVSIYWGDSLMGIVSAVCGVAYVVCNGKGKLSAYLFGVVNCVLYAIISYHAGYYGETMLNAAYYLPMQFVGFYVWSRHMNTETHEVQKSRMKLRGRLLLVLAIAVSTVLYGLLLRQLGDTMPFIDSFTTVSSVIAMVIAIRMYAEQWWIWFAVDLISVYMWWKNFQTGSDNMATLLMWVVYLANAVIMLIRWEREAHQSSKNVIVTL